MLGAITRTESERSMQVDGGDTRRDTRALEEAVDEALAQIPEAQASAFRLLKGEGLSIAEVAAIMGTSKGSVKLRAHRAYLSLRALLGKRFFGRSADGDPSVHGSASGERQGQ